MLPGVRRGLRIHQISQSAPGLALDSLLQRNKNLKTLREGNFTVSLGVLFHGPISPYIRKSFPGLTYGS